MMCGEECTKAANTPKLFELCRRQIFKFYRKIAPRIVNHRSQRLITILDNGSKSLLIRVGGDITDDVIGRTTCFLNLRKLRSLAFREYAH
jgi:hypothetical protein